MDPVFIIGTERSGTNILRIILHSHSNIAVPHTPQIMKHFHNIEHRYGDLWEDKNFIRLIKNVCKMMQLDSKPWKVKPDWEEVLKDAKDRNLISICFQLNDQYLFAKRKKRWVSNSPSMIYHVDEILSYYPKAKFIYMVRDGRDVAVTAKSGDFNFHHEYYTALLWKKEQQIGLSLLSKLPKEQIMLMKYEELISDPLQHIHSLYSFMGEELEDRFLYYKNSKHEKNPSGLKFSWKDPSKPTIRGSKGKYKWHLSPQNIKLFESIAFKELDQLGYPLSYPIDELKSIHTEMLKPKIKYQVAENLLSLKTTTNKILNGKNTMKRIKKHLFMKKISILRTIM